MLRLLLLLLCGSLWSCTQRPAEPQPQQVLHDRVLEIHDEAMILMSPIYSKIKDLRFIKDSTELNLGEESDTLIFQLVQSEEAMMNWMAEWKTPSLDSVSESTIQYLQSEEQKIIEIKELMTRSIERADSFLHHAEAQI